MYKNTSFRRELLGGRTDFQRVQPKQNYNYLKFSNVRKRLFYFVIAAHKGHTLEDNTRVQDQGTRRDRGSSENDHNEMKCVYFNVIFSSFDAASM